MSFISRSKVQEWEQTDKLTFTMNPQTDKDIYLLLPVTQIIANET